MSHKVERIFLIIFVLAHVLLATTFALRTPYRQEGFLFSQRNLEGGFAKSLDIGAPDERQHANYIGHLLKEGSLPIFDPKSTNLYETYQSHQPPGYYFIAKTVASISGETTPESKDFGRNLRLLNVLFGALAIVGTYFAAKWGTNRSDIAIVAAAFQALVPMNLALSGAISNDPLLICVFCWGSALLFRIGMMESPEDSSGKLLITAGALCGLSVYIKMSGLILLTIGIFSLGYWAYKKKINSKYAIIAILLACLLPLPVLIRNQNLYGDPTAQKAFKEAFVGSAQKAGLLEDIQASGAPGSPEIQYWVNWVGYWTARSFIGVFGYMDIWMNESGRANSSAPNWLYKAIISLNFAGIVAFGLYLRSKVTEFKSTITVALPMICLTLLLFAMFNNTYFQAQARYLFPAIASISLVLAIGWLHMAKQKWQVVLTLVVVVFGGLSVYSLTKLPQEFEARISGTLPSRLN